MHRSPGEQSPRSAQKYALTCPQNGRFHPARVTTDGSSWPLLRHRLLREAHGFEGLRVIPEPLLIEDPAITHHKDVCDLQVHLRAVDCCDTPYVPHGNAVAGVDEVADRFHYVGVPGFADVLPLAHDRLPAYPRSRLRPTLP